MSIARFLFWGNSDNILILKKLLMEIRELVIKNFRSIKSAEFKFGKHNALCGANNIGKSTLLEAMNLALGPDRIGYYDCINEFDFYNYEYLAEESEPVKIFIEVKLVNLSVIQRRQFSSYLEFWDKKDDKLVTKEELGDSFDEKRYKLNCLRVFFEGYYDEEEDEFIAKTFFSNSPGDEPTQVSRKNKRDIGFLYLRGLRTGTRAFSLERGSLLDIIFQLKEIKYKSWKKMIDKIKGIGNDIREEGDFDEVLNTIEEKLGKHIQLGISEEKSLQFEITNLTRQQLRKEINLFIRTIPSDLHVPYRYTGSGSINVLLYALLSIIADIKREADRNVIFAMEEPEIAITPYTQRQLIKELKGISNQTFVTSHSPFVVERFIDESIITLASNAGVLEGTVAYFEDFKEKKIKSGFRSTFAEGLFSNGIIAVEGISDRYALYAVSELLEEFEDSFISLDLVGIIIIDCGGAGEINKYGASYSHLNKKTYALYDSGEDDKIDKSLFNIAQEHDYDGIEDLLVSELPSNRLKNFLDSIEESDVPLASDTEALMGRTKRILKRRKGTDYVAKLISQCKNSDELPETLVNYLNVVISDAIS